MDLDAGSECLDPGINLYLSPDSLRPIDVLLHELLHGGKVLCLEDSEHMGAAFCGSEGDQSALLLERLQSREMLFPEWSALFESIRAVSTPQNKTRHDEIRIGKNFPSKRMARRRHQTLC